MARRTVAAFCFPLVSNSDIILPKKIWGFLNFLVMLQRAPIYSTTKGKSFGTEEKLRTGAQKSVENVCSEVFHDSMGGWWCGLLGVCEEAVVRLLTEVQQLLHRGKVTGRRVHHSRVSCCSRDQPADRRPNNSRWGCCRVFSERFGFKSSS